MSAPSAANGNGQGPHQPVPAAFRLQRTITFLAAVAQRAAGGQAIISSGSLYAVLIDLSASLEALGGPTSAEAAPARQIDARMEAFDAAMQAKVNAALEAAQAKMGAASGASAQQQADAAMFATILRTPELKAKVQALVAGEQAAPAPAPG